MPASRFPESRFPAGPLLRDILELQDPLVRTESVQCLAQARVVTADYELIQADFPALESEALVREYPELGSLEPAARDEAVQAHIDGWLLRHAGVISIAQTQPNSATSTIPFTGERVRVHRPPRYGRAVVVPVPGGLLDVKGVGVRPDATPNTRVHRSGLMYLGEALGDLAFQRVIDKIFRHCNSTFWTLPTYAILDLGFDAITGDGKKMPAGSQIRRAHRRPIFGGDRHPRGSLEQRFELEIELILRHYGLTSCNSATTFKRKVEGDLFQYRYGGAAVTRHTAEEMRLIHEFIGPEFSTFEGMNIQMIREVGLGSVSAQVVDFGHFEARDRFEHPLLSLVHDRVLGWGGMLRPDDAHYPQPIPELTLPPRQWGIGKELGPGLMEIPGVIRQSNVDRCAFSLAARFSAEQLDRRSLEATLEALVDNASADWPASSQENLTA